MGRDVQEWGLILQGAGSQGGAVNRGAAWAALRGAETGGLLAESRGEGIIWDPQEQVMGPNRAPVQDKAPRSQLTAAQPHPQYLPSLWLSGPHPSSSQCG